MSDKLLITLEVDVQAPGEVLARPVAPGDTLRSGEGLSLRLWTDRPACVAVLWYGRRGWSTVLYPLGGDGAVAAMAPILVTPPGGGRFYLDDAPGEEILYALAAPGPVLAQDAELRRRLRVPGPGPGPLRGEDEPPPPPPPDGVPPDKRGDEVRSGPRVQLRAGPDGVALLRFSFQHAA